jgi:uncharacterized protein (TIRG00374 family)
VSFVLLLIVALAVLIIDHSVDRVTILMGLLLVVLAVGGTIGSVFLFGSKARLERFSAWLTRAANATISLVTRRKKQQAVKDGVVAGFFMDVHEDYLGIRRDKKILLKPFLWSLLANIMDVALIYIAFWSFGIHVNPAIIFIAFGLSSIASAVSVTPGGAGVYEAVMVAFLGSAGVPLDVAIAGTLLARVLLMIGTIAFGYVFYQVSVVQYGKAPVQR